MTQLAKVEQMIDQSLKDVLKYKCQSLEFRFAELNSKWLDFKQNIKHLKELTAEDQLVSLVSFTTTQTGQQQVVTIIPTCDRNSEQHHQIDKNVVTTSHDPTQDPKQPLPPRGNRGNGRRREI